MRVTRKSIQKTEHSDLYVYCEDASQLFTFAEGGVMIQLSLPYAITDGVYSLCDRDKLFPDYLLFAVNLKGKYIDFPGIYAAFTHRGIVFTFWTKHGKFSIYDTSTNIGANESFVVGFHWDRSGELLGEKATMAIFINDACTAAGQYLMRNEDISGLEFFGLDSTEVDFNMECSLEDFAVFSSVATSKIGQVDCITNYHYTDDTLLFMGRKGAMVFSDSDKTNFFIDKNLNSFAWTAYCTDIDDLTGNIYFGRVFTDGYDSGSVSKYDVETSSVTARILALRNPRAVRVIQRDGIDYPKSLYVDGSGCTGVWIADESRVILADADLNIEASLSGFDAPYCLKCLNDGSCWVSDSGNNKVKHVSVDGTAVLTEISVQNPSFLVTTNRDDVVVYSRGDGYLYLIRENVIANQIYIGSNIAGMDCSPNSGDLVVAKTFGVVTKYNRNLAFKAKIDLGHDISMIFVRRGHDQDHFVVVDNVRSKVFFRRLSNINVEVTETDFDDSDVFFSGTVAGTGKIVASSITPTMGVELEGLLTVDTKGVSKIDVSAYKVDRVSVDLTGGRDREAYLKLIDSTDSRNPTDDRPGSTTGVE